MGQRAISVIICNNLLTIRLVSIWYLKVSSKKPIRCRYENTVIGSNQMTMSIRAEPKINVKFKFIRMELEPTLDTTFNYYETSLFSLKSKE